MRAPACGSSAADRSPTNRLARGSASRFFVCAASRDSSRSGAPCADSAYGVTDRTGSRARWTEIVDSTPDRFGGEQRAGARTAVSLADGARHRHRVYDSHRGHEQTHRDRGGRFDRSLALGQAAALFVLGTRVGVPLDPLGDPIIDNMRRHMAYNRGAFHLLGTLLVVPWFVALPSLAPLGSLPRFLFVPRAISDASWFAWAAQGLPMPDRTEAVYGAAGVLVGTIVGLVSLVVLRTQRFARAPRSVGRRTRTGSGGVGPGLDLRFRRRADPDRHLGVSSPWNLSPVNVTILPTPSGMRARSRDRQRGSRREAGRGARAAAGNTPRPVYADLARRHREDGLSFARAIVVHARRVRRRRPDHPASFRRALHDDLYRHVDLPRARAHALDGQAARPRRRVRALRTRHRGGGRPRSLSARHRRQRPLAFNEPGSPFDSRHAGRRSGGETRAAAAAASATSPFPAARCHGHRDDPRQRAAACCSRTAPRRPTWSRAQSQPPPSPALPASALQLHAARPSSSTRPPPPGWPIRACALRRRCVARLAAPSCATTVRPGASASITSCRCTRCPIAIRRSRISSPSMLTRPSTRARAKADHDGVRADRPLPGQRARFHRPAGAARAHGPGPAPPGVAALPPPAARRRHVADVLAAGAGGRNEPCAAGRRPRGRLARPARRVAALVDERFDQG